MVHTGTDDGAIRVIHGHDAVAMAKQLLEDAGAAAGLPPGGRIALKPNLVVARPAGEGATTHPEVLAGAIEYFQDHGHHAIEIIESSWVGEDTRRAFSVCGIDALKKRYCVAAHDLKKDAGVRVSTPIGEITLCRRALETDFLINVPVLKGHCQTRLTCCLKNLKGCITDAEKRRFHRDGLHAWIGALATAIQADLVLVDGLCGDLDFEEGGNPVPANRLFLARDAVKMDAYGCELLGIDVTAVEYIGLAEAYGVGSAVLRPGDVRFLNRPKPVEARPSGKVARLARHIAQDRACSACYANTIHALKRLEEAGMPLPAVRVGQGWRGRPAGAGAVGVGECCRAGGGWIPGCPPSAGAIVRHLTEGGAARNGGTPG